MQTIETNPMADLRRSRKRELVKSVVACAVFLGMAITGRWILADLPPGDQFALAIMSLVPYLFLAQAIMQALLVILNWQRYRACAVSAPEGDR